MKVRRARCAALILTIAEMSTGASRRQGSAGGRWVARRFVLRKPAGRTIRDDGCCAAVTEWHNRCGAFMMQLGCSAGNRRARWRYAAEGGLNAHVRRDAQREWLGVVTPRAARWNDNPYGLSLHASKIVPRCKTRRKSVTCRVGKSVRESCLAVHSTKPTENLSPDTTVAGQQRGRAPPHVVLGNARVTRAHGCRLWKGKLRNGLDRPAP